MSNTDLQGNFVKYVTLLFAAACLPLTTNAQDVKAAAATPNSTAPIIVKNTEGMTAGAQVTTSCSLAETKTIPELGDVFIIGKQICKEKYFSDKTYYEVLYEGKRYFISDNHIKLTQDEQDAVDKLTPEQVAEALPDWTKKSKERFAAARAVVLKELDTLSKVGLGLRSVQLYDVSEHTEGTGLQFEAFNPTKKVIKYVTLSVTGLNAVGDPIRTLFNRTTVATFRGVGPIESMELASYSKDYLWHTDLVEKFKLTQVKVEYMDGSSKTFSGKDVNKTFLPSYVLSFMRYMAE